MAKRSPRQKREAAPPQPGVPAGTANEIRTTSEPAGNTETAAAFPPEYAGEADGERVSEEGGTSREQQIARRAYDIYSARGGQHGRALDDWLQAERELDERR